MKNVYILTIVLLASMGASAQDTTTNSYTQTNLVSDIPGMGTFTDPHLVNPDRKSTRLNSSHLVISYAVFCLKKKTKKQSISIAAWRGLIRYANHVRCRCG